MVVDAGVLLITHPESNSPLHFVRGFLTLSASYPDYWKMYLCPHAPATPLQLDFLWSHLDCCGSHGAELDDAAISLRPTILGQ